MENIHHESHQFYFERYLRNKMNADERDKLEKRLSEDEELKKAFDLYKLNRQQFMRELISEHTGNPYKSWISKFIYMSIAIAAGIFAANLYYENKTLLAERQQDKNLISRLLDNIPFVGNKDKTVKETETEKTRPQVIQPKKTKERGNIEAQETKVKPEPVIIKDTALIPISRLYIEQRFTYYRNEVDTGLTDAELINLIYRNSHKYAEKYKSRPIGVAFIDDDAMNRSYKFDGNKLLLYGLPANYPLLLVKDENELVWMNPDAEIILIADNQLHTY